MSSLSARYYERFSLLPFEEDMTHEFKGHRNFCSEELPHWVTTKDLSGRPSRKPVSRNFCGFLNTGQGGTVYCGVVDEGVVHGLTLTLFQKDHVVGCVQDVLSRFKPAVPSHRYKIKFVPVLGANLSEQERTEMLSYNSRESVDPELRKRKHVFRSAEYCWCDQDGMARYKNGTLPSEYVIEVTILPWDCDSRDNQGLGSLYNLYPIYADDKGDVYFRRQASLHKYSVQEIARLTYYETEQRKQEIISRLKAEISALDSSRKTPVTDNDTDTTKDTPEREKFPASPIESNSNTLMAKPASSPLNQKSNISQRLLTSSLMSLPESGQLS